MGAVFARFPFVELPPRLCSWRDARSLNRAGHVFGDRRRQLDEFSARRFQREAVLIVTKRRIRPEGRNALRAGVFRSLQIPIVRRAVSFRWHPPFDVPAIERRVRRGPRTCRRSMPGDSSPKQRGNSLRRIDSCRARLAAAAKRFLACRRSREQQRF